MIRGGWRHAGNQLGADTEIDYTLPAGVPLIVVTEDLIPRINEQLAATAVSGR